MDHISLSGIFKYCFHWFSRSISNLPHSLQVGQISLKLGMQLQNFIHFYTLTQNQGQRTIKKHYRVESTNCIGDFHWFKKCRDRGTDILKVRLNLIGVKISYLLLWGILLKYNSFLINFIYIINFKDISEGLNECFRCGDKFKNSQQIYCRTVTMSIWKPRKKNLNTLHHVLMVLICWSNVILTQDTKFGSL